MILVEKLDSLTYLKKKKKSVEYWLFYHISFPSCILFLFSFPPLVLFIFHKIFCISAQPWLQNYDNVNNCMGKYRFILSSSQRLNFIFCVLYLFASKSVSGLKLLVFLCHVLSFVVFFFFNIFIQKCTLTVLIQLALLLCTLRGFY